MHTNNIPFAHNPLTIPSSSSHYPIITLSLSSHYPLIILSSYAHHPLIILPSSSHHSHSTLSSSSHPPLIISPYSHPPLTIPPSSSYHSSHPLYIGHATFCTLGSNHQSTRAGWNPRPTPKEAPRKPHPKQAKKRLTTDKLSEATIHQNSTDRLGIV
jgi:hypothetical protein